MPKKPVKKRNYPRNNKQNPVILVIKIGVVFGLFFIFSIAFIGKKLLEEPTGISASYEEAFIDEVAETALVLEANYGVRPSVTIAQAILESNWGQSELAQRENNYYGIKGSNPSGGYTTKEFEEEEWVEIEAQFRSYGSLQESMEDYANLMANGTEWDENLYREVIEAPTYEESAEALREAGYATDPDYPEKLIALIEEYDLHEYDQVSSENGGMSE